MWCSTIASCSSRRPPGRGDPPRCSTSTCSREKSWRGRHARRALSCSRTRRDCAREAPGPRRAGGAVGERRRSLTTSTAPGPRRRGAGESEILAHGAADAASRVRDAVWWRRAHGRWARRRGDAAHRGGQPRFGLDVDASCCCRRSRSTRSCRRRRAAIPPESSCAYRDRPRESSPARPRAGGRRAARAGCRGVGGEATVGPRHQRRALARPAPPDRARLRATPACRARNASRDPRRGPDDGRDGQRPAVRTLSAA